MVLAEAFGHRVDADTDSLGPPAGTDPGVEESENMLADGSRAGDKGRDQEVVLVPGVLRGRPEDSFLAVAGAEWMVAWRCRIVADPEVAGRELAVVDSCLAEDVGQPQSEERCTLEAVQDQELLERPMRSLWKSLVALKRAKR